MRKNIMRTPEEKEKIVLECMNTNISRSIIAQKYNTNEAVIRRWVTRYNRYGVAGLVSNTGRKRGGNKGQGMSKGGTELDKLNSKILKLEIENERLKKGYEVKGVGETKEYVTTFGKNTKL